MLYWILPNSPQAASWLEPWEQQYLINRLVQDSGTKSESCQWSYIVSVLTDWKIWLAVIVYWGNSIPLFGFTYSAPSIILGLGYTGVEAQLLTSRYTSSAHVLRCCSHGCQTDTRLAGRIL